MLEANEAVVFERAERAGDDLARSAGELGNLALGQLAATDAGSDAFAGIELGASLGGEIKDPTRTLPRAVYLSAPLVAGLYIVGTIALLWLLPVPSINIVSGFLQAIQSGAAHVGPVLAWAAPLWLWTLYTGFIAYLLVAILFGAEWLIRSWRFHHLNAPWADPLLRRLFPEGPTA